MYKLRNLAVVAFLAFFSVLWTAKTEAAELNINIGSISTLTGGPVGFSTTSLAAKAVFDSVNAAGGIQKRKIQYTIEDDQGNPDFAAKAAAKLVSDPKLVVMAGGASVLECSVNAKTYLSVGLISIPGLGLDNGCFTSEMIAPVNAGPNVQLDLALQFAAEQLKVDALCTMRLGFPTNLKQSFDAVIQNWNAKAKNKLLLDLGNIQYDDDPQTHFSKIKASNCKAIVFAGPYPFAVRYAAEGKKALGNELKFIFIGSAYTTQFAQMLGVLGDGMYAMSEFEPWSSRSGSLTNWRNLMAQNKIPLTSSSQGGYLSAQVVVKVLRSIEGEINRNSVRNAFQKMADIDSPMIGMPFSFGYSPVHHPNQAAVPVQLSDGVWRIAHHDWIKSKR
jgi:branched-chain amino acid transport system substrate-binding protein